MNANNKDGNYDKILSQLKWKPNSSVTDLLKAMVKYENSCNLDELIPRVGDEQFMDELADFIKRKNENGKYNQVLP